MKNYEELIKQKKIPQLFVFGMYRSGTTVIARSLAGENKIAFASDPIRPLFNCYRSALQKNINLIKSDNSDRPFDDYFNNDVDYIERLLISNFSEKITLAELIRMRKKIIQQGSEFSPKFTSNLEKSRILESSNFSSELKYYLSLIISTYGNSETCLVGLKEVWCAEMALPIINMLGEDAKIIMVLRNPLDIVASSITGSPNYSILSLVRQWRKQVVFYKLLKAKYPKQVACINYEDFCSNPALVLNNKIKKLINGLDFFEKYQVNPLDDDGNSWKKNSSYLGKDLSKNIDKKSIGKFKEILSDSEIEWINYLTHMSSYKRYNQSITCPTMPISFFPKRNADKVANWAKLDLIKIEENNLREELQSEHRRIEKIYSKFDYNEKNAEYITIQI